MSFGSWHAFSPQNLFFPLRKWFLLREFPIPFKKHMKPFFRKVNRVTVVSSRFLLRGRCRKFDPWIRRHSELPGKTWTTVLEVRKLRSPTLGLGKQMRCFMGFQQEGVSSWSLSSTPGVCALLMLLRLALQELTMVPWGSLSDRGHRDFKWLAKRWHYTPKAICQNSPCSWYTDYKAA